MKNLAARVCVCGKPVPGNHRSRRYCSRACANRSYRERVKADPRFSFTRASGPRFCPVCKLPSESRGWCLRCQGISRDIAAALGEPDTLGEREYTDAARRMAKHRSRARTFPKTNARGVRL